MSAFRNRRKSTSKSETPVEFLCSGSVVIVCLIDNVCNCTSFSVDESFWCIHCLSDKERYKIVQFIGFSKILSCSNVRGIKVCTEYRFIDQSSCIENNLIVCSHGRKMEICLKLTVSSINKFQRFSFVVYENSSQNVLLML